MVASTHEVSSQQCRETAISQSTTIDGNPVRLSRCLASSDNLADSRSIERAEPSQQA